VRLGNWLLLLLAAALLTTAVLPVALSPRFRPDPFAVLLVFVGIRARRDEVLPVGWLTGLARDLAAGGHPGVQALTCLALAAAIFRLRRPVNTRHPIAQAAMGGGTVILMEAPFIARAGIGLPPALVTDALGTLLGAATITAVLTPPALWLLDRLNRWVRLGRRPAFGAG